MKTFISMKKIRESYNTITVGYCDLQDLLQYETPTYYNSGVYGWNCDIYIFGDTAIMTGYRPIGGKRAKFATVEKFNNVGKYIESLDWHRYSYKDKRELADKAITDFINEVGRE